MTGRRVQHPSIFRVGLVHDDGKTVTLTGWGVGLCPSICRCHRDPLTGRLTLYQDQRGGRIGLLGLIHYDPPDCDCCSPWTHDELAAVLRGLAALKELDTIP